MIRFLKTQGLGNDFVLLDGIEEDFSRLTFPELSREMCDRRFGVGADGLLLAEKVGNGTFRMRMWNPDGSEAEMCGNGIRCFAKVLVDKGHTTESHIKVETGAGLLEPALLPDGQVRVDMGPAGTNRSDVGMAGEGDFIDQPVPIPGADLRGTAVSMGNPHLVVFVDDVQKVPLAEWGSAIECHDLFPKRINVHFAQVASGKHLIQRTWERGAGATLACGTGACAVAVAGRLTRRSEDDVTVSLPGGELRIECREGENVFMTGQAVTVFEGEWPE